MPHSGDTRGSLPVPADHQNRSLPADGHQPSARAHVNRGELGLFRCQYIGGMSFWELLHVASGLKGWGRQMMMLAQIGSIVGEGLTAAFSPREAEEGFPSRGLPKLRLWDRFQKQQQHLPAEILLKGESMASVRPLQQRHLRRPLVKIQQNEQHLPPASSFQKCSFTLITRNGSPGLFGLVNDRVGTVLATRAPERARVTGTVASCSSAACPLLLVPGRFLDGAATSCKALAAKSPDAYCEGRRTSDSRSSNKMESSPLNSSLVLRFSVKKGLKNGGATERLQGQDTDAQKLENRVGKNHEFSQSTTACVDECKGV